MCITSPCASFWCVLCRLHEDSEAPVYRVWFSERYEFGDDDGSVGDLANEIYEDLGASGSSG